LTRYCKTIPNSSKKIKIKIKILTAMLRDKRPDKGLRLAGPPPHTRSIDVIVRLE